jgi:hypothetical protein
VLVGPQGVVVDDQPVPSASLSIATLAGALHALALPVGTRVAVIIDEAWVRSLLLSLPAGLTDRDEIRAYASHRLRDTFGAGLADWPQARAGRSSLPWPGARWQRHMNPLLLASLTPQLLQVIDDWCRAGRLRLVRLGTAWGEALTAVPPLEAGALAVFRGQRMSVGAWSGQRWLGWRSFIAHDGAEAAAETLRWMSILPWQTDRLALWCQGWSPVSKQEGQGTVPERWSVHALASRPNRRRAAPFEFRSHLPGHALPLRQKVLGLALLATLAASVWVTLPLQPPEADEEAIVSARILPPRARVADEGAADTAPGHSKPTGQEDDGSTSAEVMAVADTPAEVEAADIAWPRILGTFEQQGRRWVLYSTGQESASLLRGAVIDRRYRIERADADSVVLTDLHTLQQQQTVLENTGVQP